MRALGVYHIVWPKERQLYRLQWKRKDQNIFKPKRFSKRSPYVFILKTLQLNLIYFFLFRLCKVNNGFKSLTVIFLGGCRSVLYHAFFSSVIFINNPTQVYIFRKLGFFSFIWYQIRLNMVKLKVGNDLNNMKSMGENSIQSHCHGNRIHQHT